jgi:hypothetical protein
MPQGICRSGTDRLVSVFFQQAFGSTNKLAAMYAMPDTLHNKIKVPTTSGRGGRATKGQLTDKGGNNRTMIAAESGWNKLQAIPNTKFNTCMLPMRRPRQRCNDIIQSTCGGTARIGIKGGWGMLKCVSDEEVALKAKLTNNVADTTFNLRVTDANGTV